MTSGIDTRPEGNLEIPQETYLPLVVAVGLAGALHRPAGQRRRGGVVGAGLAVVSLVWWAWRTEEDLA